MTDLTFTVTTNSGYGVKKVTYKVDDGDPVVLEADNDGVYTILGGDIKGDITLGFEEEVVGVIAFTSNDNYNALPSGYKLMEFKVTSKLSGAAYEYEGSPMYYSTKYSELDETYHIYVYAVEDGVAEEEARAQIQIVEGDACEELQYSFDVNGDGRVNSTDVVLTYGFYKGVHKTTGFSPATMKMRLNADIDGNRMVDTTDAQLILNHVWGKP